MTRARDMANLGSQAGSGLDASDITSGVLPSGVTGGSGLTALGTVATGNLSNTAIVYPAGHVIQTTNLTQGATETNITGANNNWQDTVVTASITPTYSNSKVVIFSDFVGFSYNQTGDGGWAFRYKRAISGGATSYPNDISSHDGAGNAHSAFYWNSLTNEHMKNITTAYLDSPATTSAITYTLQAAKYNMESLQMGGQMAAQWHIWFQEIAQ